MALPLPSRRDVVTFAAVFGLLGAVTLLPPDTALRQVRAAGTLRACAPPDHAPLVTADPARPGIDVELLRAVARELGVGLSMVANPAMGQDFNPRAWRVTRAQCDVIAGGVVGSPTTRSFLETTQPYALTGWAWLARQDGPAVQDGLLQDQAVGVLAGVSGLDRIGLGAALRAARARVTVVPDRAALVGALRTGEVEIGIAERLQAASIAAAQGWHTGWMPASLPRYPLVLGLWKGDLTLKRAIVAALARLQRAGVVAEIVARYAPGLSAEGAEPGR